MPRSVVIVTDVLLVVPKLIGTAIEWMSGASDVAYMNLILAQDDVNQKLPWDIVPFYWTQPTSPNAKHSKREKLRITASSRSFRPVDLNTVRKRSHHRLEDDPNISSFAASAYQKAQMALFFVPFVQLKTLILVQAGITTFFVVGLSATAIRLTKEAFSEQRLSLNLFDNAGYWTGAIGVLFFIKMLIVQWSFGALQDHWVLISLVLITNMVYLFAIKLMLPIVES